MPDRVTVVGAGAMGSVFAARLRRAGADVTLLDVDAGLVDRIARDGLILDGPDGREHVRVPAVTAPAGPPADLALFFVKCHATRAAAQGAAAAVGPGTTVVSLQNGWGNGDVLAAQLGAERLVVGVTYVSATVRAPGQVAYSGTGPTHLGPWVPAARERAAAVAALLRAGGLDVAESADVRTEIWRKLVLNAATLPTAALTGLTAGALGEHPEMSELVRAAAAEAVAAARAGGLDVDETERREAIAGVLARAGAGKGSMLQDVEAGRRTENDVISGAVLRAAAEHGLDLPVTRTLHALVRGLEHARGLA